MILGAVFGVTEPERRERLRRLLPGLLGATSSSGLQLKILLARRVGRPGPLVALREQAREIDAALLSEIAERRRDPAAGEREDILSLLTLARFDDGGEMDACCCATRWCWSAWPRRSTAAGRTATSAP